MWKRERSRQICRKINISENKRIYARIVLIFQRPTGKYMWMKLCDYWDLLQINPEVLGWRKKWVGSQMKTLALC